MAREPRLDDPGAELLAQVDREVRQAELVRERARAATACAEQQLRSPSFSAVRPQLERDGDAPSCRPAREQRGDGGVDAAAHRDQRPARARGQRRRGARRRRARGAARRRRARRRGAWPGSARPARARSLSGRCGRVEQRGAAQRAPRPHCPRRSRRRSRRRQTRRLRCGSRGPRDRCTARCGSDRHRPPRPRRRYARHRGRARGRAVVADARPGPSRGVTHDRV